MNFGDEERVELNELCGALVDGTLDAKQRARLSTMLAASEEARRFYVQAMALSASLHEYAGEMQIEAPEAPEIPAHEVPARLKWTLGALAAAAAVVAAFWLGSVSKVMRPVDREADESVAQISGAKNCVWRGAALQPGDELRRGQKVELTSGVAEITFDSGAQVTIEGPATLSVSSEWEAALERGTLKAVVPAEAIGFRLANPAVEVVDAGTEFSVVADAKGAREVFVTKGAIEVQSREEAERDQPGLVLHENQARRFSTGAPTDVRDRDQKLARLTRKMPLDHFTRPASYAWWSFDELRGATIPRTTIGAEASGDDARIEAAEGKDLAALVTPGRFGGALRFDGSIAAEAPFPGLSQRVARTVALWVKIPAEAPLAEAGAMLSWSEIVGGAVLEVGWNRNPSLGTPGALRTVTDNSVFIGRTPLRDGRWHHVAIVLTPARKADGMQVRQYVDGRLEGSAVKRLGRRAARSLERRVNPFPDTLWIGRGLDDLRMHGEMDELFIADRALAPQEIRQLMHRNQPLRAEPLAAN